MASKDFTSSTNPRQWSLSAEHPNENASEGCAPKYVIQRTSETNREWWTGAGWSEDENNAYQYSGEPEVSVETLDESAKAVRIEEVDD